MSLLEQIKKAAVEAVNASEPCDWIQGEVTSVNPLTIRIDQKMELTSAFLSLTSNVTDYETTITDTDTGTTHNYTVNNGLTVGDKVLLLSQKGGQTYAVLDKLR